MKAAITIATLSCLIICGCGGSSGTNQYPSKSDAHYLFVQEATGGSLQEISPGTYHLILTGTNEHTIYFSERPYTDAGSMPTSRFMEWFSWEPVPPNAALVLEEEDSTQDTLIVALSEPSYDTNTNQISYTIKITKDYSGQALNPFVSDMDLMIPPSFGKATLFIDDFEVDTCGGAIAHGTLVTVPEGLRDIGKFTTGDQVMGSQDGKTWSPHKVTYAMGTDPATRKPALVFLEVGDRAQLIVSLDTCLLKADGTVTFAKRIRPGDSLMGSDGTTQVVHMVNINEFKGGLYALRIGEGISKTGYFIGINGLVATEFMWQGKIDEDPPTSQDYQTTHTHLQPDK